MNHALVEQALGGTLLPVPETDFGCSWALLTQGESIYRWVELRARPYALRKYPTLSIPVSKVVRALEVQRLTGIPALLVVRFEDGVYTVYFSRFTEQPLLRMVSGLPMWHVSVEMFQLLIEGGSSERERLAINESDEL